MADIGITSNRASIHFNAIPSNGPGNTGLAAQINSNFECRDPLDDNNPNKGEDIEYEKEKKLDNFNQVNLPESESQNEPKSDLSFSVASSSKEPIEDSYSVWLPSAIKSEPIDSEERESESEDENLMFNEGKEEKMDEESDLEGEDDSEGGAYHLAEVSYGEDDEQGPAKREDEESDAILGINSDSSGFPLDYSISESEMKMDVFKNGSNSRFLTYLCRVCGHRALGKDLFLDHVQRHGELFGLQPLDRRPYRRIKHPDRLYLGCVICEYKSNSKDSLTKHLLESHSSEFSFCCPDCEFTTDKYYRLRSHVRKHNPIYACSLCPYKTGRVHYLKEHYRVHTKEKPYACNECSFRCASKNSLGKHMRVHTGETPYECKLCERKFKQSGHLTEHMRQHTGEKPFKCHICDYRCAYRGLINKHIRSHSDERPFACTVCDFSCKARYTLTSHMRSHTGEKAYRCKLCDFQCNSRSTFRDHEYKHNGKVLPYECDICNTRFVRERALKRHIMVHDKQPNSLSCNVCGMLFLSRIKLQDHYTTHPRPKPS